nr:unnamed protein product [Digitaria exilis]
MFHESLELLHRFGFLLVAAEDAEARGGLPEVATAPPQDACPHGLLRWQEREHVVEDLVGEHVEAGAAGHRTRHPLAGPRPAPSPRWHSVERVASHRAASTGGFTGGRDSGGGVPKI